MRPQRGQPRSAHPRHPDAQTQLGREGLARSGCILGKQPIEEGAGCWQTRRSVYQSSRQEYVPKQSRIDVRMMIITLTWITYEEVGVFDWGLVVHGAEEVFTEGKDHELLKEAITEHKLLGGTGNVAVVVQDSHTSVTSNLNLKSYMVSKIRVSLSLAGREGTHIGCTLECSSEGLVSNLINHCYLSN